MHYGVTLAGQTEWDVDRYADRLTRRNDGKNANIEMNLQARYPPMYPEKRFETNPMVVTDQHQNAILWYLPQVLTRRRQVGYLTSLKINLIDLQDTLWNAIEELSPILKTESQSTNWRTAAGLYRPAAECRLKPGTVSMSPAWFELAHDVGSQKYPGG